MHYEVTAKSVVTEQPIVIHVQPMYDVKVMNGKLFSVVSDTTTLIPLVFDTKWHISPDSEFVYRIFLSDLRLLDLPCALQEIIYEFYASGEIGEYIGTTKFLDLDTPIFGTNLMDRIGDCIVTSLRTGMKCKRLNPSTGSLTNLFGAKIHFDVPNIPSHNWTVDKYSYKFVDVGIELEVASKRIKFGTKQDEDVVIWYDKSIPKSPNGTIPVCLSRDLRSIWVRDLK